MAVDPDHMRRCPILESLAALGAAEVHDLRVVGNMDIQLERLQQEPVSTLFNQLREKNQLHIATGFVKSEIISIYQVFQPYAITVRQPGAKPMSTWLDQLLCYLTWLKLGVDYAVLSCILGGISSSCIEDNINHVRPFLRSALHDRWLQTPSRPMPLRGTHIPHAALIIDNHTTSCFWPKAVFEEAKIYYDGKNKVYGLKTEVAVAAHEPHYCVFVGKHEPGSKHDYQILKSNYQCYLPYLAKSTDEHASLTGDMHSRLWAVIVDLGYVGPDFDTPDLRRFTPIKDPRTPLEEQYNQIHGHLQVPVECFFGRLVESFGILRGVYRWSHESFDDDFTIGCCLVNEKLATSALNANDQQTYKGFLIRRMEAEAAQTRKRKEKEDAYRARKCKWLFGGGKM